MRKTHKRLGLQARGYLLKRMKEGKEQVTHYPYTGAVGFE